jgi:TolB-like protein
MGRCIQWIVSSLAFFTIALVSRANEKSELVRIYLSDKKSAPIVGEIIEESENRIVFYDLSISEKRELKREQVRRVARDITESSAASVIDLPHFVTWKIHSSLPLKKPSGKIAKIDKAIVYANLGGSDGLESGDDLLVYRTLDQVRDPDSKKVLDQVRRLIGKLKVTEVRDNVAKCTNIGEYEVDYKPGDEVESKAKNIIAVLPFRDIDGKPNVVGDLFADELTNGLVAAKIPVVERTRIGEALTELEMQHAGGFAPEAAQKLGRFIGAAAIITGSVFENDKTFIVSLRLVKVSTGEILFSHSQSLPGKKIKSGDHVMLSQEKIKNINTADGLSTEFARATKHGNWHFQNGTILFTGNKADGMLDFPVTLPRRFELALRVRPSGVGQSTCIALYLHGSTEIVVQLAADGSCVIIDGNDPRSSKTARYGPVFIDRQVNQINYEVDNGVLIVAVNNRQLLNRKDKRLGTTDWTSFSIGALGEWSIEEIQSKPVAR